MMCNLMKMYLCTSITSLHISIHDLQYFAPLWVPQLLEGVLSHHPELAQLVFDFHQIVDGLKEVELGGSR